MVVCKHSYVCRNGSRGRECTANSPPPPPFLPAFIVRYTSQGISASNQLVQQPIKECDSVSCASKPHIKTPYINLRAQAAHLSSPSKFLDPPSITLTVYLNGLCMHSLANNYSNLLHTFCINFYPVPLLRAHGVDIQPPLIVDSRSQIKISWNPQNLLPPEHDPDSYRVDVYVYTYEYSRKNRKWRQRSVNRNLPNNGGAVLKQINFSKLVKVVAIHVTASEVLSTSDPLAQIITSINEMSDSIPFPSRAGIWSGLLFSIENKRLATDEEAKALRNQRLNKLCSRWGNGQSRMLLAEKFTLLPACPPTQDRAELPNSGLEEARFDSVLYNTDYQTQWIEYFNQGASKCFTQATVTR